MKSNIFVLCIFVSIQLIAQKKGATPLASSQQSAGNKTYAVVIGISDYQDPGIPDLRFADKDAEAFANFLRSEAGGKLDNDHLKVLINSQATMAQFASALDWLMELSKEGDQAIIYFSGHGDVERRTITQPGFLLCWDAPARVYMGGGAFALPMLQEVISTLSLQNKSKVIVITDACRSGTLAGNSIGGAQATAANLAKQFANEIKILSCQPNEYSIEGEQWGGGRGAFSYNLVEALYGMADGNGDLTVTLQEVGRYLEDHVTEEVAPVSQVPMVIGNRMEKLSNVNVSLLADLRSGKTNQIEMLTSVEMRGLEEEVLSKLDSNIREMYLLFKQALKEKVFLYPRNACADAYYERLLAEPGLGKLHSTLRRNYAAALQDDAQQELNTLLKSGLTEQVLSNAKASELFKNYPSYLERAAQLLGREHYLYPTLQARKHYFEACLSNDPSEKKKHLFETLHWQADMPHAYNQLIALYPETQIDSAEYYASKALELVPNWVVPYVSLAKVYQLLNHHERAEQILHDGLKVDSNSLYLWYAIANFYSNRNQLEEAEYWYKKVLARTGDEICFPCAYNNLGTAYDKAKRYSEAEKLFRKAIQLDSGFVNAWANLAFLFKINQRYPEAEAALEKLCKLDSNSIPFFSSLGSFYLELNRPEDARRAYFKAYVLDSTNIYTRNALGRIYFYLGRYDEAIGLLNGVLDQDSTFSDAWSNLGMIYYVTNRFTEAEKYLMKYGVLEPHSVYPWYNMGNLCSAMKRYNEAEEYYNKALELDSTYSDTWSALAMVYFKTRYYKKAALRYARAIQLNPSNPYGLYGRARLNFATGEYKEAIRYFDQVYKLDSNDVDNLFYMGIGYLQTGALEKANYYFQKIKVLDSVSSNYSSGMSLYFLKTGDEAAAERLALQGLSFNSEDAFAAFCLASIYSLHSQNEKALDFLEKSLNLGYPVNDSVLTENEIFSALHENKRWKEIIKSYFPEGKW